MVTADQNGLMLLLHQSPDLRLIGRDSAFDMTVVKGGGIAHVEDERAYPLQEFIQLIGSDIVVRHNNIIAIAVPLAGFTYLVVLHVFISYSKHPTCVG